MARRDSPPNSPDRDAFWQGAPPPEVPAIGADAPRVTLLGEGTLTADGRPLLDHLNAAYRIMQEQARRL